MTSKPKPKTKSQPLSRDAILGADDLPREKVDVPEWGGFVYVRTMTALERDRWEQWLFLSARKNPGAANPESVRANLAAQTLCDAKGVALFTPEDIPALAGKSAAALDCVVEVAQRLNRLTSADIEELAGNSETGPSAGTTSDSPDSSA